jgi:hypothetical protein
MARESEIGKILVHHAPFDAGVDHSVGELFDFDTVHRDGTRNHDCAANRAPPVGHNN